MPPRNSCLVCKDVHYRRSSLAGVRVEMAWLEAIFIYQEEKVTEETENK